MLDAPDLSVSDDRRHIAAAPFDLRQLQQHAERAAGFLAERYGERALRQAEKLLVDLSERGASTVLAKRVVQILAKRERPSPV